MRWSRRAHLSATRSIKLSAQLSPLRRWPPSTSGASVGTMLSPARAPSRPNTMADDPNPLEEILRFHAEKFRGSPYAGRVARLARTAKRIPAPLLDDLATLITQLDDVQLVGNDLTIHLIEVGFCDARY